MISCAPDRRRASVGAGSAIALAAVLLAAALAAACASSPTGPRGSAAITNPFLGPAYAQWLVGPISRMATPEEIDAYLALEDDLAAADFIETWWARRDPDRATPGNPVRDLYNERAAEADRAYSEAGLTGRRTARGTIYVLYGPPDETDYQIAPQAGPAIEVWTYADDAEPGLDGVVPETFRFQKRGDVTGFYRPQPLRRPI